MERTLFGFIWRYSKRQQLIILAMTVLSFPILYMSLELPKWIVNDAISQVSSLRGRLGAFQKNIVGATIRSLGVALENTSAAESSIRDTDFAAETAELTRSQILVNAATNVLAISNSQPQSVLSLLG